MQSIEDGTFRIAARRVETDEPDSVDRLERRSSVIALQDGDERGKNGDIPSGQDARDDISGQGIADLLEFVGIRGPVLVPSNAPEKRNQRGRAGGATSLNDTAELELRIQLLLVNQHPDKPSDQRLLALSNATADSDAHSSYEDRPTPTNAKAPNAPTTNTNPTPSNTHRRHCVPPPNAITHAP
ncbi:hypothetical protein O4214_29990 [Rhodococcus erythropolis]|uniref:hypothetical protein n=1 Tax=Rhodococcus erythropolis TaxID=1833 RepID=UPI001E4F2AF2|nr:MULTISPECIES: hypothetical protein [Rhodococcus erythropolis group]MCD2109299.1 hypothetical protein [Rhodococcus qingshengii]MCZ4528223.1 hypothetical protein [Rhodococcus erythropolis]